MNKLKVISTYFQKGNYLYPDVYIGSVNETDKGFTIGMSPPDSENYYTITIGAEKEIVGSKDKFLFVAKCNGFFRVPYTKNRPSKNQLFQLVLRTIDELNNYILSLPNNPYGHKKYSVPEFSKVEDELKLAIELWNTHYNIPYKYVNHRFEFQNFPIIPMPKRFINNKAHTEEQEIINKIHRGFELSAEEEIALEDLLRFYQEFRKALTEFHFDSLNHKNRVHLKEYINSAFNFIPTIASKESIPTLYRIVKNRNLNIERVTNKSQLIYPPLKLVKKHKIHSRANTDNSTVMYCSTDLKATFMEVRDTTERITLGVWQPNQLLTCYTIPYLIESENYEDYLSNATRFVEGMAKTNPKMRNILKTYYQIIANEFTKPVSIRDKYSYLVSGWFSEKFLTKNLEFNGGNDFDIDCLLYPSVENQFKSTNVAVRPDRIEKLSLIRVFEYENIDLDKIRDLTDVETLKLGKSAKHIDRNGNISW